MRLTLLTQARQRLRNWRRGFFDRALKVVDEAYIEYKRAHPKATRTDIAKWVLKISDSNSGAAFWQAPVSDEVG